MKKFKMYKSYGTYYYDKVVPNDYNELDAPIYTLYDENKKVINEFGSYSEMCYFIKTGNYL